METTLGCFEFCKAIVLIWPILIHNQLPQAWFTPLHIASKLPLPCPPCGSGGEGWRTSGWRRRSRSRPVADLTRQMKRSKTRTSLFRSFALPLAWRTFWHSSGARQWGSQTSGCFQTMVVERWSQQPTVDNKVWSFREIYFSFYIC